MQPDETEPESETVKVNVHLPNGTSIQTECEEWEADDEALRYIRAATERRPDWVRIGGVVIHSAAIAAIEFPDTEEDES